jgi:hypothetical protein
VLLGAGGQINYDFHHFVTPEKLDQLDRRPEERRSNAEQALQRTQPARNQSRQQALWLAENSESLDTYLANDGYKAFLKARGDDARADHRRSERLRRCAAAAARDFPPA